MALQLSQGGIESTVVTDSAIYAVMARVNKVILGAHAVTANGGIVATTGTQIVCAAAKHHSTPVVVCSSLHALTPSYMHDTDAYLLCVSPQPVLSFENGDQFQNVDIPNPYYDYVQPELLSLIITNMYFLLISGPHPPSEVQRLVSESYV